MALDPRTSKLGKLNLASPALHPDFEEALARVSQVSIEKGYDPLNWLDPKNSVTVLNLIGAAKRHIRSSVLGYNNNQESRQDGTKCPTTANHLEHAAYGLLMASVIIRSGLLSLDDRLFIEGELKGTHAALLEDLTQWRINNGCL